ncbi:AAA domain-containing protein [uncultured Tenacibaculum sp.]|uniref:DEAD/DEAH box helicase n=1 Tax=uncultured Tenacibaculum sp. TaxID=174713 RepID=UPI00261FACBC|nr:AAA domain-containing protein [uncultured Tenacibaculum sp.]
MNNEKNWLHYYKNSLFDSENLAIDISRIKNLFRQNNSNLSTPLLNKKNATVLLDAEENRINRLRGITKKDSNNWHKVEDAEILIAPFHLQYQTDNPKFKDKVIYPFWVSAKIDRSGNLKPPRELFPLIVRNFLAPVADVKNDFIFSSIDTVVQAQEIEAPYAEEGETIGWDLYWDYVNEVFAEVTRKNLSNYKADRYTTKFELTYFATSSKISTAKSILFVYDNLLDTTEEAPLLSKLISPAQREKREAVTDFEFLSYNHLHLGQMSNEFPLSITQRKTLLSYLSAEENSVMAVNGPPGTGKTTLLQSLVATEVVKAAIRGEDAPLIVACSNNNQAVTNIIDSFINSKSTLDDLAERWIPNFHGYATYLPSSSKSEKALKGINFLKGNLFGHEGTLCDLEDEQYLFEAKHYFLDKFNTYFNLEAYELEDACNHLQEEIFNIEDQLLDSVDFPSNYLKSIAQINKCLCKQEDIIQGFNLEITKLQNWRKELTELKSLEKNKGFLVKGSAFLSTEEHSESHTFKTTQEVLEDKKQLSNFLKQLINQINVALQSNLKLKTWIVENNIKGFPSVSEEEMWKNEYSKLNADTLKHEFFYDELDLNLRHKAFLLATHYWEARWILQTTEVLEEDLEKGTGENAIREKWKRRAMLTPCFVATFYTAPSHFFYSQFIEKNQEGRPIFEYYPLYNFLDLLIIDEAGQVTPEVSVPMFAVAQKAFVIGDLKQIEPIWSIPPKIDLGNLSSVQVVSNPSDYEYLKELGFLASNGSIMKMAQNSCEYVTTLSDQKEQGLILLEHRRCNDEIIGFCNELAYNGILKPMKGKAKEDQVFSSMVAYHVNGVSERKYNSRCNMEEVKAITTWLQQNKEHIQNAYNVEDIESVLGIITPFASQKGELSKALTEAGYNVNKMKLGTVHALQGAERNIILFSSVYSNDDEGTLFFDKDNKPNMLNVAVSRAKDSFILFGDTRIFDETQNTPSGVLKKHLSVHEMVN